MSNKFKVGDVVRVITNQHTIYPFDGNPIRSYGQLAIIIGTVSRLGETIFPLLGETRFALKFKKDIFNDYLCDNQKTLDRFKFLSRGDRISNYHWKESEIEAARVKLNKLSKKLYPKAEISECGEWLYV